MEDDARAAYQPNQNGKEKWIRQTSSRANAGKIFGVEKLKCLFKRELYDTGNVLTDMKKSVCHYQRHREPLNMNAYTISLTSHAYKVTLRNYKDESQEQVKTRDD
ncbi:hypothetical protein PoB_003686700 [Plakobranchus ocellatus]|uniref:Uncharacterized protein n=1 Tax=Plakobranchus ocellatus TaxID=259542 RepID=A0AAV4ATQ7_9GAST|nr:hypothetical protein PoB_003686700 [Plakobranchus ocellatus]